MNIEGWCYGLTICIKGYSGAAIFFHLSATYIYSRNTPTLYFRYTNNYLLQNYIDLLFVIHSTWQVTHPTRLRQSMSALVGDQDLYPWVFQLQNAVIGSVWVSATRWLKATSQKLVGSWVLVLNRNKVDYIKYIVNTNGWSRLTWWKHLAA